MFIDCSVEITLFSIGVRRFIVSDKNDFGVSSFLGLPLEVGMSAYVDIGPYCLIRVPCHYCSPSLVLQSGISVDLGCC